MLSNVKFIPQNFEAIAVLQAELCLVKVEKLDACIRLLFANPVTILLLVFLYNLTLCILHNMFSFTLQH